MNNDKHSVTFDGEPLTREISISDVKAYMVRKGFRLGNRDGSLLNQCEMYTLVPVGSFGHDSPVVFFMAALASDPSELKLNVHQVAHCLGREPRDVLREIASESVTLEDAMAALMAAHAAACSHPISTFGVLRAPSPSRLVAGAADLAEQARGYMEIPPLFDGMTTDLMLWLAVAEAAEDLAAIALTELRRERTASPKEPQS